VPKESSRKSTFLYVQFLSTETPKAISRIYIAAVLMASENGKCRPYDIFVKIIALS